MKKIISNKKQFERLINKNGFQVFLFTTPLYKPYQFAIHSWIVTVNKGKINRWEVWQNKNSNKTSWGYFHKNLNSPSIGIKKYRKKAYPKNKSKIIGYLEGGKNSLAETIVKFVEKNAKDYPLRKKYSYFPGPNSNTFPQWIIDKFPKLGWKLPWNAFGKNYPKKIKVKK